MRKIFGAIGSILRQMFGALRTARASPEAFPGATEESQWSAYRDRTLARNAATPIHLKSKPVNVWQQAHPGSTIVPRSINLSDRAKASGAAVEE